MWFLRSTRNSGPIWHSHNTITFHPKPSSKARFRSSRHVARNHPGLMNCLVRFFSSWPVARDMAGIKLEMLPASVLVKHMSGIFRNVSPEQTTAAIQARYREGNSLLGKAVIADDRPLYNDGRHFFGMWWPRSGKPGSPTNTRKRSIFPEDGTGPKPDESQSLRIVTLLRAGPFDQALERRR